MSSEDSNSPDKILEIIRQENEGKFGIICLNCLIVRTRFIELKDFVQNNNIRVPLDKDLTKLEYLDYIGINYYNEYINNSEIRKDYPSCLTYIASMLLRDEKIKYYLSRFDFIAKHELIDIFADYCADLGISVYDTSTLDEKKYSLDLYLIKKKPFLRTESVIVRTGPQMTPEEYKNTFYLLNEASKVAAWTVFVTTPNGVYNIGFRRLISDMEKLNVWFYVVDPIHRRVLGVTKGKKSKDQDTTLRDNYIRDLPREPIRAPSKIIKISEYEFSESDSYNPKKFVMYELLPKEKAVEKETTLIRKPKYKNIFRSLLIISRLSGLPLITYSSEDFGIE